MAAAFVEPESVAQQAELEKLEVETLEELRTMKTFNSDDGSRFSWTEEEEKAIVRKFDFNVLPLVSVLYLLSYLDRSNIGNARTAGMADDLKLSSSNYAWLLTIFYISYICFEPATFGWKLFKPRYWVSAVVMAWGILAVCQAAVTRWSELMAIRFFMGAVEAAYGPGVPLFLSFFYLKHEVGYRIGYFFGTAALASAFAGALAYGIVQADTSIANWKLLFLVEGAPTIIMAVVAFFTIANGPGEASFLNERQRQIALARGVTTSVDKGHRVSLKEVGHGLMDIKNWITALMYFSCNVSFSSLPVFLPTILSEMGFTSVKAQGLSAPPYVLSFLVLVTCSYISDKVRNRGFFILGLSFTGGVGYLILAVAKSTAARYTGVFLAAAGIFPSISIILPWVLNNQGNDSKKATGLAMLNLVGQCGPLLGTRLFPTEESPYYVKGMSICSAFMFFVGILAMFLQTYLRYLNRLKDQEFGPMPNTELGKKQLQLAVSEDDPHFRYTL